MRRTRSAPGRPGAPAGLLPRALAGTLAGVLLLGGLSACTSGSSDGSPSASPSAGSGGSAGSGATEVQPAASRDTVATDDPALDAAVSSPVEDDVYPEVGDPGVDALHYGLDLRWSPAATRLTATESLVFRATADARDVRLDLGDALEVRAVTVDGRTASYDHPGKELVVHVPVTKDQRYTMVLAYGGTPLPAAAPTTRSDFSTLGWTTEADGSVWTMQEPYGAYTWYAVNDQPSDKALYDFTISTTSGMTGIANGTLRSMTRQGATMVTRWHLDEPASSYLTTIAIGRYRPFKDRSASGVPVTYWVPATNPRIRRGLRPAADELGWIENKLGPYPFSSLGIVLVHSRSGMETQTMLTLGIGDYTTSPEVIVHEMVHQWYGDEVTPATWTGLWMSEGMAMYLQGLWQSERGHTPMSESLHRWRASEPGLEEQFGPPADYDPATFGESNAYYGPALMWDALRRRLGDREFWSLVRAWPKAHEDGNASYDEIVSWFSQHSGQDLRPLFDSYLLGRGGRAGRWPAGPAADPPLPSGGRPPVRRERKALPRRGLAQLGGGMRLLVLGGSVFLSRAVAEEAVRRGHEVTCACRGTSGSVPSGALQVVADRSVGLPAELDGAYDAVVDVARHPSWVRAAVARFPDAHWVFVSTINVYADDATPGGGPGTLPLREPVHEDVDLHEDPEAYGPMKVACEQAVLDRAASAAVVRPGLIVGPGDPSGRFAYWPARLADTGDHPEVLLPGSADATVQVIDVRDLAAWLVTLAEERRTGTFDGTGQATTRAAFTDAVAAAARELGRHDPTTTTFTAVPQEFLLEQDVQPWTGPRSVPVWLPLPEYAGLMAHDVTASYDAGLVTRPLAETARDTLLWLDAEPDAPVTGWSRADEAEVLAAWHARG